MLFVAADLEFNFENETNFEKCLGFYVVIGILAAELITSVQTLRTGVVYLTHVDEVIFELQSVW